MHYLFTVLGSILVIATAQKYDGTPEEDLYQRAHDLYGNGILTKEYNDFVTAISFPAETVDEIIKGLTQGKSTESVTPEDLKSIYWHPDLAFAFDAASKKLTGDSKANIQALLEERNVKYALLECKFVKSTSLRESCFADLLATYLAFLPPKEKIEPVFRKLYKDQNHESYKTPIDKNPQLPVADSVVTKRSVKEELGFYGNANDALKFENFYLYATRELVLKKLRVCMKTKTRSTSDLWEDKECLYEVLTKYAESPLTLLAIPGTLGVLDTDESKNLKFDEFSHWMGWEGNTEENRPVFEMLDLNKDNAIDFEEWSVHMKQPTHWYQLEDACINAEDKTSTILSVLVNYKEVLKQGQKIIPLVVPGMEKLIIFEIMDVDDNGKIEESDLKQIEHIGAPMMHTRTIDMFMYEFQSEYDEIVDLHEFYLFVSLPHMVYSTAGCLVKSNDVKGRGQCYPSEIVETIDRIKFFEEYSWKSWFLEYSTNGLLIQRSNMIGAEEMQNRFLDEMLISPHQIQAVPMFEFQIYLKQKKIADRYEKKGIVSYPFAEYRMTRWQVQALKTELTAYLTDSMSVRDVLSVYRDLLRDVTKDVIEAADEDSPEFKSLLSHIKKFDFFRIDEHSEVNFRAFWLWVYSRNIGPGKSRRVIDVFEEQCIRKGTRLLSDRKLCYVNLVKESAGLFIVAS